MEIENEKSFLDEIKNITKSFAEDGEYTRYNVETN